MNKSDEEPTTDALLSGACGTFSLPPDGTHDREMIDRFADFLRFVGPVPKPGEPKRLVSEETWRYMNGEDVAPTPYVPKEPA